MDNTSSTQKILTKIQNLYEITGEISLVEKIEKGHLSKNFVIKDHQKRFFLKEYRFDTYEKIEEIHAVKFFFSSGNIPIILPIQNKLGDHYFEHQKKFYSLFPFVIGKTIQRTKYPKKATTSSGKMLAEIHMLSKDDFPKISCASMTGWEKENFLDEASMIKEKIKMFNSKSDFDALAIDILDYKIKLASKNTIRCLDFDLQNDHIIHGDYHEENIFYDEDDQVKYIFDLERAKTAPRAVEVARSTDLMFLSEKYTPINFENAKIYLSAYNGIYPLEKSELEVGFKIYYLKRIHSLWIEREHYIKKNLRVDHFLRNEFAMLRYYTENFDYLIKKITS